MSAPALPIAVRRARPADTDAVLDFTRATWDGWDYIPLVWRHWLSAPDGVLLVATPQGPPPGSPRELDLFGRPLPPDRPIAIARVALLAPGEAWLEGLRVDPGVRNRGVAGLLQAACLAWAAALGATRVRYATGQDNEGSHRLGARFGFRLLRPWRSYQQPREADADAAAAPGDDTDQSADLADDAQGLVPADVAAAAAPRTGDEGRGESPEGLEPGETPDAASPGAGPGAGLGAVPPAATAWTEPDLAPGQARALLAGAGLALDPASRPGTVAHWWSRVDADPTFVAGERLYEFRGWTFQALTRERFAAHVRAGEVLVTDVGAGRWGVALLPFVEPLAADERPWAALIAGSGEAVLQIAVAAQRALARPIRLRVPDGAPVVRGHEAAFTAAGFLPAHDTLHVLSLELASGAPVVTGPPGALVLEETPGPLAVPPPIAPDVIG